MSFPLGASLYTVGFGTRPENVEVPVLQTRAPTSSDISYPIGKRWVDQTGNGTYTLTSFSTFNGVTTANWQADSGTSSGVLTINSNAPIANNYIIAGTANQATVSQTAGTSTISTPATFIAPGSIAATTTLTATLGAITAINGNFVKGTAGNKDIYSSVGTTTAAGANSAGTVTLVGGTATVATTAVTASSLIRLYRQGVGATGAAALGIVTLGTITAGTSFVINSVQAANATALQASDVSVVFWEIVN